MHMDLCRDQYLTTHTHTHVERAVRQAENDHDNQIKWAAKEDEELAEKALVEIHSTVEETIDDEKNELEMIQQQCNEDIGRIGVCVCVCGKSCNTINNLYNIYSLTIRHGFGIDV